MKGRSQPEELASPAPAPHPAARSGAAPDAQRRPALRAQEAGLSLDQPADAGTPLEEIAALEERAERVGHELDHAVYDEYVRGFDAVPTLYDAVGAPPRRPLQPDFRHGERPDQRKEQRLDALTLRETRAAELERSYREYAEPAPAQPQSAAAKGKKPKRTQPRKTGKRKKR